MSISSVERPHTTRSGRPYYDPIVRFRVGVVDSIDLLVPSALGTWYISGTLAVGSSRLSMAVLIIHTGSYLARTGRCNSIRG